MKTLSILRDETGDQGTFGIGTLTAGDNRLGYWDWIELPWRDNLTGISCIPAGTYQAHMGFSSREARDVYILQGVDGRSAIELHPANWAGDTTKGFFSDLRGCAAPGIARGEITPPHADAPQAAILQSHRAFDQFMLACNGEPIEVQIAWKDGLP